MQKPVWREGYGEYPQHIKEVAYIYCGDIYKAGIHNGWAIAQESYHVGHTNGCFYNTNRTKAAKYEVVECLECDYFKDWLDRKCPLCNGKGHTLERIK